MRVVIDAEETGFTRTIDDQGKIAVPSMIREDFYIRPGDRLEFYKDVAGKGIYMRRVSELNRVAELFRAPAQVLSTRYGTQIDICDMKKVLCRYDHGQYHRVVAQGGVLDVSLAAILKESLVDMIAPPYASKFKVLAADTKLRDDLIIARISTDGTPRGGIIIYPGDAPFPKSILEVASATAEVIAQHIVL